ncbi:MAG: DUF3343 domain-containing protein [Oscillospiraceae bacterium]
MMNQYIIMCRSLTYAQRASRVLERAGIFSSVTKAPMGVSPEGCTYGVRLRTAELAGPLETVRAAGIKTGRIYEIQPDGSAREVTA